MDATPLQAFRLVATEFSGVSDETVESWFELCEPLVSRRRFRRLYNQALALLAAHRMKLAQVGGSEGGGAELSQLASYKASGVSNVSEGETSIGFANAGVATPGVDSDYALTDYGTQFLSLRRMVIMPIISAGEPIARTR
jgi:hypothetical protein